MTDTLTLIRAERRTKAGLTPSLLNPAWTAGLEAATSGTWASVKVGRVAVEVSKLDGESGWTIDAAYAPNGAPVFVNGFGARYLRTHPLSSEHQAMLERLIAREGVEA